MVKLKSPEGVKGTWFVRLGELLSIEVGDLHASHSCMESFSISTDLVLEWYKSPKGKDILLGFPMRYNLVSACATRGPNWSSSMMKGVEKEFLEGETRFSH